MKSVKSAVSRRGWNVVRHPPHHFAEQAYFRHPSVVSTIYSAVMDQNHTVSQSGTTAETILVLEGLTKRKEESYCRQVYRQVQQVVVIVVRILNQANGANLLLSDTFPPNCLSLPSSFQSFSSSPALRLSLTFPVSTFLTFHSLPASTLNFYSLSFLTFFNNIRTIQVRYERVKG